MSRLLAVVALVFSMLVPPLACPMVALAAVAILIPDDRDSLRTVAAAAVFLLLGLSGGVCATACASQSVQMTLPYLLTGVAIGCSSVAVAIVARLLDLRRLEIGSCFIVFLAGIGLLGTGEVLSGVALLLLGGSTATKRKAFSEIA